MMFPESVKQKALETVLVVDEDREARRALAEALANHGYQVVVSGPSEALCMAERAAPAATLLDLGARSGEGIDTLRALNRAGSGGVIIVLTANGTLKTAREAMLLGAHDYVTKPFHPEFLRFLLAEGIAERAEQVQQAQRSELRACGT